jgi:nucleotide-binding universal stress UspA family protein
MKNVLLLVHDDDGQEARVQAALDLARTLKGHLTCLDVVRIPEFLNDYATTAGSINLEADERSRATQNRHRLENRFEHEEISWDWVHDTGDIAEIINHRIDLTDVIVLNTTLDDPTLPDMRAIVSATAVKSKKPVLAVPYGYLRFAASGCAMVAWDGSEPAVAALRAATPILTFASSVTLVEIDHRPDHGVSAEDGAAYLSRHGVHAAIQRRHTEGMVPVSTRLLEAANDMHADYIVMGAYGHSRLTEAVFGGVTRSMLSRSAIPLILAH